MSFLVSNPLGLLLLSETSIARTLGHLPVKKPSTGNIKSSIFVSHVPCNMSTNLRRLLCSITTRELVVL